MGRQIVEANNIAFLKGRGELRFDVLKIAAVVRSLERNFIIHVTRRAGIPSSAGWFGRLMVATAITTRGLTATVPSSSYRLTYRTATVEHGQFAVETLEHHFGGVFVLARLILPLTRLQLATDVNL